jgi:hypothetical protein
MFDIWKTLRRIGANTGKERIIRGRVLIDLLKKEESEGNEERHFITKKLTW